MLMKLQLISCLLAAATLLPTSQAVAAEMDSGVPLPAPIGVLPDSVRVNHLLITVRGMKASLRYDVENQGDKPASGWLSVYSPLFMWEGSDTTYPDKSFPELRIQSRAGQIPIETHIDAYHRGQKINDRLTQSQLDPLLIAKGSDAPVRVEQKSSKRFRSLVKDGIVSLDGEMLVPNWLVLVSRSWMIGLPAHGATDLQIDYDLRPAFEPIGTKDPILDTLLRNHCANVDQVAAAFKAMGLSWPEYGVVQQYQIPVRLGSLGAPAWLTVDFAQAQPWAGLTPRVSVVCQENGTAAIGTPFLKALKIRSPSKPLSILVFLPQ